MKRYLLIAILFTAIEYMLLPGQLRATSVQGYPADPKAITFITDMYNLELYKDYDFLEKHCTKKMLKKLIDSFEYDAEGVNYAINLFRSGAQDVKYNSPHSVNPSRVLHVVSEGDSWYTYTALDGGIEFANKIQLIESQGTYLINDISAYYVEGDISNLLDFFGDRINDRTTLEGLCELIRETLGDNSIVFANILRNLAVLYIISENWDDAQNYLQKASYIYESVYGQENEDYIETIWIKAQYYQSIGDYTNALQCYQTTLKLNEKIAGKNHAICAQNLYEIGCCQRKQENYTAALASFQQALSIYDDPNRPFYIEGNDEGAQMMPEIAICLFNLGENIKGADYLSRYTHRIQNHIVYLFNFHDEHERADIWDEYSAWFTSDLYGFSSDVFTGMLNKTAYDGALFGKGLLLHTEMAMRELILESGDERAIELYDEVKSMESQLSLLGQSMEAQEEFRTLTLENNSRRSELFDCVKSIGGIRNALTTTWSDVQAALDDSDIAIEFVTYAQDTTTYLALTIKKGYSEPHLIKLFDEYDLKKIKPSRYYSSSALTNLIWGKLGEELDGVKNVYFSPVGELYNIGIEHLLDSDGEHLISDKRNYYRLTSTRELAKESTGRDIADVTIYGGIRYDVLPVSKLTGNESFEERESLATTRSYTPENNLNIYLRTIIICLILLFCIAIGFIGWILRRKKKRTGKRFTIIALVTLAAVFSVIAIHNHASLSTIRRGWAYLPGTKDEAEAIASTLSSKKVKTELLEGESGTEESFKALSGAKKDVIHIATHGFYWTETEAARSGMETSSFMLDGESQAPKEDKALTRSGLLFAGAQNAFEGKDIPIDVEDGILTAKDISRMDLRGTDLVVISACQSGLGEVTGDGVFGLQRGFKKAGVQSIVMSLWEVSDEATKIMMTRFYENLAKGKSKYDAFREAQRNLRKYESGLYDEPVYYAAFVLLDAIK